MFADRLTTALRVGEKPGFSALETQLHYRIYPPYTRQILKGTVGAEGRPTWNERMIGLASAKALVFQEAGNRC